MHFTVHTNIFLLNTEAEKRREFAFVFMRACLGGVWFEAACNVEVIVNQIKQTFFYEYLLDRELKVT